MLTTVLSGLIYYLTAYYGHRLKASKNKHNIYFQYSYFWKLHSFSCYFISDKH